MGRRESFSNVDAASPISDAAPPPVPASPSISLPPSFPLFPLFFQPRRSRHPAGVFAPGGFKTNLATVPSLFSLLLLGHLAGSASIHGNQGKWQQLLGEYQHRQASISVAATHYQSNGEAAAVTPSPCQAAAVCGNRSGVHGTVHVSVQATILAYARRDGERPDPRAVRVAQKVLHLPPCPLSISVHARRHARTRGRTAVAVTSPL